MGEAARAASDAIDAWCAANPLPAWTGLPEDIASDYTEIWSGILIHDPASGEATARFGPVPDRVEVWIADGELRANPIMCEQCGAVPAVSHGVDGWVCDGCAEDADPRYEG